MESARLITAFTSARQLSLSLASSIQSIPPHPTYWRSILISSSHLSLGLSSGFYRSGFPTKTLYAPLLSPTCGRCPPISFFLIWSPEQYLVRSADISSVLEHVESQKIEAITFNIWRTIICTELLNENSSSSIPNFPVPWWTHTHIILVLDYTQLLSASE
jgi:hypothetical protein